MEIVGNYLHSASWSVPKLFTIIYKNSFDKNIVFQIDLSSIYHSFYIFITILCRGCIYIFNNIVFILFALMSSTRQISPSHFWSIIFQFLNYFLPISSFFLKSIKIPTIPTLSLLFSYLIKKTLRRKWRRSTSLFKPFLQSHYTQNDPIFHFFTSNTPLKPS